MYVRGQNTSVKTISRNVQRERVNTTELEKKQRRSIGREKKRRGNRGTGFSFPSKYDISSTLSQDKQVKL